VLRLPIEQLPSFCQYSRFLILTHLTPGSEGSSRRFATMPSIIFGKQQVLGVAVSRSMEETMSRIAALTFTTIALL
jgi:hypothetical protein